jgi:transposase
MLIYFLVFFVCLFVGIAYVFIIWQFLKRTTKTHIPSPFSLGENFWREWKKFGIVYLIWDITRFVIEMFVLWTGNAIVIRLVAIMLTFSTSGFFGRWRNVVLNKIKSDVTKHYKFWEFMWDTFASLVFWVPMYIVQLMMLVAFDLTHWSNVWYGVYVQIWAILMFGRFGCFAADLVERWLFGKKE